MDLAAFVEGHRPRWARLASLLDRVEAVGLRHLSLEEAQELGRLYRQASSDLLTARGRALSAEVVDYLNDLVARGYALTFPGTRVRLRDAWTFLSRDFPRLVRQEWRVVGLSYLILLLGVGFGFGAMARDPLAAEVLLPAQHLHLDPDQRVKDAASGSSADGSTQATFASMLFTHNIQVAFLCFALGLTLGVGTVVLLFYNGLMLGALAWAYQAKGHAVWFWAWILPHGVVELSAICLASAGGLVLARGLLAPGERSAGESLRLQSQSAVRLVLGTLPLFVVAGLTEGTLSQLHQPVLPAWFKLAYAAAMGGLLMAYLGFAGRAPADRLTAPRDA